MLKASFDHVTNTSCVHISDETIQSEHFGDVDLFIITLVVDLQPIFRILEYGY